MNDKLPEEVTNFAVQAEAAALIQAVQLTALQDAGHTVHGDTVILSDAGAVEDVALVEQALAEVGLGEPGAPVVEVTAVPIQIQYRGDPQVPISGGDVWAAALNKFKKHKSDEVEDDFNTKVVFYGPPTPPVALPACKPMLFSVKTPDGVKIEGDKSKRLFTRYGFEFAFMPKDYDFAQDSKGQNYDGPYNQALLQAAFFYMKAEFIKSGTPLCERMYVDGHVVEIPSSPASTIRGVYNEYAAIYGWVQKYKMAAQSAVIGTGSNHINLDLEPRMITRLMRDIANRPYLYWAFNDPCDTQDHATPRTGFKDDTIFKSELMENAIFEVNPANAKALMGYKRKYHALRDWILFYTPHESVALESYQLKGGGGGGTYGPFKVRQVHRALPSYGHLEWPSDSKKKKGPLLTELRFFEAPANWVELKAQIDFVEAYLRFLARRPWSKFETPKYRHEKLRNLKVKKMEEEFTQFLHQLHLDPNRYGKYFQNLRERYKLGKDKLQ